MLRARPPVALAALALPLLASPRSAPTQLVHGLVVDASGAPLANVRCLESAWLELRDGSWQPVFYSGLPRPVFTGADGRFELELRADLRADLDFDLRGYAPSFLREVESGAEPRVVLRRGADVRGRVVQLVGDREEPIEGARLELTRPNERGLWFQAESASDAEGAFAFPGFLAPEAAAGPARSGGLAWELVCNGARLAFEAEPGEAVEDVRVELRIERGAR